LTAVPVEMGVTEFLLWLWSLLTIVSAGWEMMAQKIPAKYPDKKKVIK